MMCVSKYIVGANGYDCRRCREAITIVKFAGFKFQYIEEEFIVSSTLGEGHVILKVTLGALCFGADRMESKTSPDWV